MERLLGKNQQYFYENESAQIIHGDSFRVLAKFRPESIDMIFADPPYFLSNNGVSCKGGRMVSVNKGDVRGWKKVVHGKFVVERHLKNGSILVSCDEDGGVYMVRGIYSSWRELLGILPMPQTVETALIPFQDVIIHDGIVMPYRVCLGKSMADQVRHMYLNAKEQKRIIESM